MTSRLLLDLALSEEQNLEININACKRVRHRQNECQICTDICPEEAISLALGPTINDNCTQCGLCINACPTETFQSTIDLEQYWLDQIRQSAKKNDNKSITLHCQHGQPVDGYSIAIHCIGNINENLLLDSVLLGVREITVHSSDCSQCRLSKGVSLFNTALDHSRTLAQQVKLDKLVVQQLVRPKKQVNEEKLSRRAFFSRISDQVKEKTLPADYDKTNPIHNLLNYQQTEPETKHRVSQRRENLRKILTRAKTQSIEQPNNQPINHWQKMFVEQEKCVACAVCVNVCPTGALNKTIDDNTLYRHYSSALCTNCGLCQEACPQEIIHFTTSYNLSDIIEDKPELVARVELTQCQICGETIPTIEGKVCTTCQKRQISPMFF